MICTKHKPIRWNFGLTPRLHSLEGELIHWVDKAKNVWLTVVQLSIKAWWWDAPLSLQYLNTRFLPLGLHKRIPNSSCFLILLILIKNKTIRSYPGLMMMMMICFCGMVDQRKAFNLIFSWEHCQRSSPSQISDTLRAVF